MWKLVRAGSFFWKAAGCLLDAADGFLRGRVLSCREFCWRSRGKGMGVQEVIVLFSLGIERLFLEAVLES